MGPSRTPRKPTTSMRPASSFLFRNLKIDKGKLTTKSRRPVPDQKPILRDLRSSPPRTQFSTAGFEDVWGKYSLNDSDIVDAFTEDWPDDSELRDHTAPDDEENGGKTPNIHLRNWKESFARSYLSGVYHHHSPPNSSTCTKCCDDTTSQQVFKCVSCFGSSHLCSKCIVSSHNAMPTHEILVWTGTFWDNHSLSSLGLVVHLGHSESQCPEARVTGTLLVGDITGFSLINICYRPITLKSSKGLQLVQYGLFPCSDLSPRTAFTLRLLEQFSIFSTLAKLSTHKYYSVLERLTNTGFPTTVSDRYRELALTHRKYCHLMNTKQSGVLYPRHPNPAWEDTHTISCISCPWPGFNVKLEEVTPEEMWILRYWVAMDGNFRLVRKAKKVDPNDISFTNGVMFYVKDEEYNIWVALPENNQRNTSGERPQCDNHKAAADKFAKFGGLDVTGLVAVSCGRHTCYIPGGVADLKKGEKFAIGDYALAHVFSLLLRHGVIPVGLTYDIWCHYIAKFKERICRLPESLAVPSDLDLVGAVPKFHLQGHTQECKVRWSLNNMPHVGRLEGKGVERGWAAFNQTSGSNSEKSPGFRHDSMNYLLNSWNLEKRDHMGPYLHEHFTSTKKMYIKQKVIYDEIHAVIPIDVRVTWEETSTEPTKVNGKWTSPFEFTQAQAQKLQKVLHDERQKECDAAPEPSCRSGASRWLLNAIEIENQMSGFLILIQITTPGRTSIFRATLEEEESKMDPTASYHRHNALNDKKKALTKRVNAHREERETFMPGMGEPDHPDLTASAKCIEHVELALPSSYQTETLTHASLDKLGVVEGNLRRASCDDALQTLKNLLGWKAQALQGALKAHNEKVKQARQRYDRSWRALMRLDIPESDRNTYRKLEDKDLRNLKDYLEDDSVALGQGYESLPWIWRVGAAYDDKSWQVEALRVKWFRARQRCKQWQEELLLLKRDMVMAAQSLETYTSIWEWKAATIELDPGMSEYAHHTANFYRKQNQNLVRQCSKHISDPIVDLKWATNQWSKFQLLE